jgi:chorismate mutase
MSTVTLDPAASSPAEPGDRIGELRASSGGMRLSLSRERQVLSRFRNALGPDGASLGMMLLRQGRGRL